jgi:Bacteriophage clamp loader A subunit
MEVKKLSPFSFVTAVTETKEDLWEGNESEYNSFIINKALSFNLDCLYHVAEINKYPTLPKNAQHKYLLTVLDKKKRYGRWVKKDSLPSDIALIKDAFGYNDQNAMIALSLLSDKQLIELKANIAKGGKK